MVWKNWGRELLADLSEENFIDLERNESTEFVAAAPTLKKYVTWLIDAGGHPVVLVDVGLPYHGGLVPHGGFY